MGNYRTKIAHWLRIVAERVSPRAGDLGSKSNFVHLAPVDNADEAGIYSNALAWATRTSEVRNVALTGPYGSGKSSIIKSFLKNYPRKFIQISLAAFSPDTASTPAANLPDAIAEATKSGPSRQEIERSILQQMLYGADASRLPFSRFKRIQTPGKWAALISLWIAVGALAFWNLFQKRAAVIDGTYFKPFDISNAFNIGCFLVGSVFVWVSVHRIYVASFGLSLKSFSLKDIQITPEAATEESILNRHLDEIVYFFQSTKYDLVIIEDLDRFDNAEIFVTLREINSIINANTNVHRTVRFLYALRDNIFVNTDRTKFFEFIIPVIPIINTSNSIDMVLRQGKRLAIDGRLDGRFLREVSPYLNDLRLIQNIFNEYSIYVANLDNNGDNGLNVNKLLAVLIYKNVLPSDFEDLHQGKGALAQILARHDEFVANSEAAFKAELAILEEKISAVERQIPADLNELRGIYAAGLIEHIPKNTAYISRDGSNLISIYDLREHDQFEAILEAQKLYCRPFNSGGLTMQSMADFQAKVDSRKTFQQRKREVEKQSIEFKTTASENIHRIRTQIAELRKSKFSELIRLNAEGVEDLFIGFGDNKDLARYLVFEGYLDDTYYLYTSLFHEGRLSPSDRRFLIQIRASTTPEPEFRIDNPKEVIGQMRDEDFEQSYVLNVKIVDHLLSDPSAYSKQKSKLFEFIGSNFEKCEAFLSAYYASGVAVSTFVPGLTKEWVGFVPAAMRNTANLSHITHIVAHLQTTDLAALPAKYLNLSEFISTNLSQILALGIDFEPSRLKLLKIASADLSGIEAYTAIVRFLIDEGLFELSVDNIDFIFRSIIGVEEPNLHSQHYTTVLKVGHEKLITKIEQDFSKYLDNVLLMLDGNTEEGVEAILSIISRDEIEIDALKAFLSMQSALIPALDQAPSRLHAVLFELNKVQPSWQNCLAFFASENYDSEILTDYLNDDRTTSALCLFPVAGDEQALAFRKYLIENDGIDNDVYPSYMRALPKPFKKFPEEVSWEKLRILIVEDKISFSKENLDFLGEDVDAQILFVERNIDSYLEIESECTPDEDFRERLLSSNIRPDQKLKIVSAMDLTLMASMPSRAAKVGPILLQADADVSNFGPDAAVAIIVNSQPINFQIALFNKFQPFLDDQQVSMVLASLPKPFAEIKRGYGIPRIESTPANLELVGWLQKRHFISSWSKGGWLGWDDDIRVNLFRK